MRAFQNYLIRCFQKFMMRFTKMFVERFPKVYDCNPPSSGKEGNWNRETNP